MKTLTLLIALFVWIALGDSVHAEEKEETYTVEYDIEKGGKQVFESEYDDSIIIIEEIVSEDNNFGVLSIANGRYAISRNATLRWSASYEIDILNNRIVSAHSAKHSTVVGSITNADLTRVSNTVAEYNFNYSAPFINRAISLRSAIGSGQIIVTY